MSEDEENVEWAFEALYQALYSGQVSAKKTKAQRALAIVRRAFSELEARGTPAPRGGASDTRPGFCSCADCLRGRR